MRKPTMTLEDIQRALESQDVQLEATHRQISDHPSAAPVPVALAALDHFSEVCTSPGRTITKVVAGSGIPC